MDNIEAFLNKLHHPALAGIDLSLDRMRRLLMMLGSPEKRLPPVVHVAGTNGKGSLLAYLQAVFEAAGYRVHKYTSPHLVQFREQIVLAGREIENRYVENIIRHITPILSTQPVTFFEATTAIAFLAFAEHKADILLLETGLGGRLDATNVIEKPLLTSITPISYDHREYLGNTLTTIAGEKAGIMKRGVPCVVGKQEKEAATVLEKKAAEMNVQLYRYGKDWWIEDRIYHSKKHTLELHPALAGEHQFDNAATAIACTEQMPQFSISDAHIERGLANAVWPARLQRLTQGKYAAMLPPGFELWLDGGHNPQGGEVLAVWLKEQKAKETYLICGMTKNKDSAGYLKWLAPQVKALYAVAIAGKSESRSPQQLAEMARAAGIESEIAPSVEAALKVIFGRAGTPAIICICGSLYLAGKVLAEK